MGEDIRKSQEEYLKLKEMVPPESDETRRLGHDLTTSYINQFSQNRPKTRKSQNPGILGNQDDSEDYEEVEGQVMSEDRSSGEPEEKRYEDPELVSARRTQEKFDRLAERLGYSPCGGRSRCHLKAQFMYFSLFSQKILKFFNHFFLDFFEV